MSSWQAAADGKSLSRRFTFPDFDTAFAFVGGVADAARALDHHPDIAFGWGYAELTLTTHTAGGLTDKDTALARQIDAIAGAA